jgi:hypothetical protein
VQKGANGPFILWHCKNDPPPVAAAAGSPKFVVDSDSACVEVVVAVRLAGAALSVVSTPLIVVRIGVTVTGNPLALTDTQGSRADSVTVHF